MSGPFAEYALAIFDAGLGEVFPVNGKDPFLPGVHGRKDSPITREQVVRWVEQYPDANLGWIPAPGLVLFDVDQHTTDENEKKRKHGAENLAKRPVSPAAGSAESSKARCGCVLESR